MFLLAAKGLNGLLDVNPGLVVWTLITFGIVVLVLKKFAWDVILKALDERAETIQNDIRKAADIRSEAEALLKDYEAKISVARDQANGIVSEAKSDATNLRNKMLEDAAKDVKQLKDSAVRDIEMAKSKALAELQAQIVGMAVQVAGLVLEKQLKADDYESFIENELGKIKKLSA
ncbi:ATP synthase F0, B subunit [Leptospira inadai serovar Lyme str. 10]|uniref:ATP synthase subunit b n=2 Tax=Leptospira inadai serovar Lyme TaxID=293084 RepID=V6HNG0_9LEPT|nr:F0F1 ATP synthase subunit B [Leptospira inadai]EQA38425.1 ATP synthase F0, B subunit [Leptospira inadai serovar Lyme str. 10]PNV72402.1 ATP synthase F0 subunit B [Leptospira inadai serovar Lyme]